MTAFTGFSGLSLAASAKIATATAKFLCFINNKPNDWYARSSLGLISPRQIELRNCFVKLICLEKHVAELQVSVEIFGKDLDRFPHVLDSRFSLSFFGEFEPESSACFALPEPFE